MGLSANFFGGNFGLAKIGQWRLSLMGFSESGCLCMRMIQWIPLCADVQSDSCLCKTARKSLSLAAKKSYSLKAQRFQATTDLN
jgi:hypothetical protein